MARGRTILTCLMWLLLVFSITLCASATAGARLGTSQQVVYPQGCRCCYFVGKPFMLRCGKVCCGDDCCKTYMFLLCNGLLVLIATSSGLIGSCSVETDIKAEKAVKMSKGGSQTEPEAEPKGSISKETVVAEYDQ
ncbi:hypothetical protein GOBAR_DD21863 [Gossypium barbadense]|nr:hypothetical protein GOBAR_DD21863 [Gossypium barbadense]